MLTELKKKIQNGGVIGAGGAGFPSYAKMAPGADTLIVNGAECEPLLYTDYVLLREYMQRLIAAITIVARELGVKQSFLAMKNHTAKKLSLEDGQRLAENIYIRSLPDVYPMGDEIILIYETTKRIVPPGKLPMHCGVIVYNVETVLNITKCIESETPVVEKWLTVGGDIENPRVVRVSVGIRIRDLFSVLGVTVDDDHVVIDGGPSMGKIVNHNTGVVLKNTKALLVLPKSCVAVSSKMVSLDAQLRRGSSACCQCTRCTDMCPRALIGYPLAPHKLVRVASAGDAIDPSVYLSATMCSSCGICETAACCQGLSPKDMIASLKTELAKKKMKYVVDDPTKPLEQRDYRLVPSERWKALLGVEKYDREAILYNVKIIPDFVEIPMKGHIGAPSIPCVKPGDFVKYGDKIADAADGLSVPQHASIDGRIFVADSDKIIIEKQNTNLSK